MNRSTFRSLAVLLLQWLGICAAFIAGMVAADFIAPLPQFIVEETPPSGFFPLPAAMFFNAAVNAAILLWAARRSSYRGMALFGQLFVLSFVAQTLQTQIETAYFLPAFPLLHGNLEVYRLVLRGAIVSALVVLFTVLISGGFSRRERPAARFAVDAGHLLRAGAWLAAVYFVLYMLFGYFVAWQSQELRVFYGGPAALNSFAHQALSALIAKPELPAFQFFRGFLWLLCLVPLFKGFNGSRVELTVLSALALGLLPTAQLAFPNPLMPPQVSLYHFWEVSLSTGLLGALFAWFVPREVVAMDAGRVILDRQAPAV